MTLKDAIDAYVAEKRDRGFVYQSAGRELKAFGRNLPTHELRDVTAENVQDFLARHVSPYLWRRKYHLLKRFFQYWEIRGEIASVELPPPRAFIKSSFRPYVYSHAEIRSLITGSLHVVLQRSSSIDCQVFHVLLLTLYGTGMRLSELLNLESTDVDLPRCSIAIRASRTTQERTIYIGSDVADFLREHLRTVNASGIQPCHLFTNKSGGKISKDALYNMFRTLLKRNGIERRDHIEGRPRLSDLRITFAVHQITAWIRAEKNLNRLLPALSYHLGRLDLTASEPLLRLTPLRFKKELDLLSPQSGPPWREDLEFISHFSGL